MSARTILATLGIFQLLVCGARRGRVWGTCVRVQRIHLKSVRRCSRAQAVCLNFWSPLLFYMIPVALLASLILWVSVYYNWKRGAPPPVCVRAPGHACRPGMRPQRA